MPSGSEDPKTQAIWQIVCAIPPGRVDSYGRVAARAGFPGLARFAGHALGRMASDSTIPWHRVLRADGRIAFPPDTPGFHTQRQRLLDEGVPVRNGRVSMRRYRVSEADASA